MPTISVIVPVYKVEEYLRECIDSILTQTYTDFELILVDDGSPDNCGVICEEYAAKDRRVVVIHQENQGLSGARNSGIDAAKGEYITFVDSDDMVSPSYLKDLWMGMQEDGIGASSCDMLEFINIEEIASHQEDTNSAEMILSGAETVQGIYEANGIVSVVACGKLFQRDLCVKNKFPVGKVHEDQAVVPILLYESGCVVAVKKKNYYYRKRMESITRQRFNVKRFDNLEAIDSCIAYFKRKKECQIVKSAQQARKRINGILIIMAECEGCRSEVPKRYRLGRFKALAYCFRYASNDTYTWYLSKLYPKAVVFHEYFLKIRSLMKKNQE